MEKKKKPSHQHKKSRFVRNLRLFLVAMIVIPLLILTGLFISFLRELPSPKKLNSPDNFAVSTQILDRNNKLLYEIYADENRTPILLTDLPPYVSQASIAIEDKNFYNHIGLDFRGIARALKNNLTNDSVQGGSTITQQLVKNALLTRERTFQRKIKEAFLTLATEVLYTKDEILEMYLNHIPYGGTAWGVEAAAKSYFGKSAKDLTLGEAALLAGLPQAPSRYSPFQSDPTVSKNRQKEVLRRMVKLGFITQEEADQAGGQELQFALTQNNIQAPHFVFFVKDLLIKKYGEEKVESGGLRVKTTLDLDLQEVAQASLSAEVKKLQRAQVGNGAALITKPNTGEILAMIGSRDYFEASEDGQVNVTIEERQPGSSIKPINLAIAFQQRRQTPGSMLLDVPTCFEQVGSKPYCPKNYDNSFHGPVQQRFALGNSYNIPAVKTAYINGVENLIDMATTMGITTWKDPSKYGISLGLGAGEVKMVDMAETYGTMANQGVRVPLLSILEVRDYTGNVLESNSTVRRKVDLEEMTDDETIENKNELTRALNRAPAFLVNHIMMDNSARTAAFGASSKLVIKDKLVSVKTGTTNNIKDNWTVGFTPEFLTIVWVGNNDNTSMNRNLVSGVTGAAPIWNDIMSYVLKDVTTDWPDQPGDVITQQICVTSGMLPIPSSPCKTRTEYFWEGTEPRETENLLKEVWIDKATGQPPPAGQPTDGLTLELQQKAVLSDPFTKGYCTDCANPLDETGKPLFTGNFIKANFDPTEFINTNGQEPTQ